MNLKDIKKPSELLEHEKGGGESPYLFSEIINLDTFWNRRLAKRKLELLKAINPIVSKIVVGEEQVFYVTDGVRIKGFEQFFVGWVAYYYNYMAFAFTSERVILVHLKSRKKRGTFIGEIRYSDLNKVSSSFLGNLVLKFKNGQSLLFSRVPKKDRNHLKTFLGSVLGVSANVKDKQGKSLIHMCPKCFTTIGQLPPVCPSCGLAFKRPLTAGFLSLLMPGLGDIYLGSLALGCFELFIMSLIWLGFLAGITDVEITGGDQTGFIIANLIFLGVIHALDGLKSSYMGRKGLYPKQKIRHEGET